MPSLVQSAALSALADLKLPKDVHISPDGSKVVYALERFSGKGRRPLSSLWIADVGIDHSARQITSGLFRDEKPRWSPDGRFIAFLSDRGGETGVIYLLGIGGFGEAYPLTEDKDARRVQDFEWSADGRYIAFLSREGGDDEKEVDADEPLVFGEGEENSSQRLRIVDVERRRLRVLTPADQNVTLFSWSPSPNTTELAYTVADPSALHSSSSQIDLLSVETGSRRIFISTNSPITSLVWTQPNRLHFIARPAPPYRQPSVYEARIKSKQYGSYFGWTGEAISLHRARHSAIARVRNPTHESAHALGVQSTAWPFSSFFNSDYEITSFDAYRHPDSDDFTLVLARSSPQVANEVWSVIIKDGRSRSLVKLSSHNSAFDGFRSKRISATGPDGWECDGWLFTPKPVTFTRRLPPTVVLLQSHSTLPSFSIGSHLDVAYLTTAGYAVLCPSIRPSGIGGGGGGINERYADVLLILKKAVSENLVDEFRVTISGWSDGGFLSSLAVIRNEFSFRAVVCGGGVPDWGVVDANSNPLWPRLDAEDKDDGYVSGEDQSKGGIEKSTPLLLLHGREDDQVPLSRPLAFWRQRQRWNGPVQMVLYPKEKHVIRDRKHLLDLWTRVLGFYERHLA